MMKPEPHGCTHPTQPGQECAICAADADAARILTMPSDELRSACRRDGMDPDKVLSDMAATNDLIRSIIEDKAFYDPDTNTWNTAAAARAIAALSERQRSAE